MDWNSAIKGFRTYLQLEKGLSDNSIQAYMRDVKLLKRFAVDSDISLGHIEIGHLQELLASFYEIGLSPVTQARVISGIRAFFRYLVLEGEFKSDPSELLEIPRPSRKLPEVLSHEEVNHMIKAIDRSQPQGERDKAIIETLYSCGLRVSELTGLQISKLYLDEGFIQVAGKGDKMRLVPIGKSASDQVVLYRDSVRNHMKIQPGHEDTLFLNTRGSGLSRISVFNLIKKLAREAQIEKTVSPHTLRHSFATELVNRGANLRAVQEMLGHQSITTTEIYTHLDRDYLRSEILDHHPRWREESEAQKQE